VNSNRALNCEDRHLLPRHLAPGLNAATSPKCEIALLNNPMNGWIAKCPLKKNPFRTIPFSFLSLSPSSRPRHKKRNYLSLASSWLLQFSPTPPAAPHESPLPHRHNVQLIDLRLHRPIRASYPVNNSATAHLPTSLDLEQPPARLRIHATSCVTRHKSTVATDGFRVSTATRAILQVSPLPFVPPSSSTTPKLHRRINRSKSLVVPIKATRV